MYVYVKNAFYNWMNHCGRPPQTWYLLDCGKQYCCSSLCRLQTAVHCKPTLLTTSAKHDDIAETGPRINVEYKNHNAKWQVVTKNDIKDFSPVRD